MLPSLPSQTEGLGALAGGWVQEVVLGELVSSRSMAGSPQETLLFKLTTLRVQVGTRVYIREHMEGVDERKLKTDSFGWLAEVETLCVGLCSSSSLCR